MMITEEDLKANSKMKALVDQALAKEEKSLRAVKFDEMVFGRGLKGAAVNLLEYDECVTLVNLLGDLLLQGKITHYTHIPNETYTTSRKQKIKNYMQGVRPGFPDYIILTPTQMIVIEMKRTKGSSTSMEQTSWIAQLNTIGIPARVCKGYVEAETFLRQFIEF